MSSLNLNIKYHQRARGGMLYKVEVLDSKLLPVKEEWIRSDGIQFYDLPVGMYVVRLILGSGRNIEKIARVKENESAHIVFDLYKISPHEDHQWAYATKKMGPQAKEQLNRSKYSGAWIRFWKLEGKDWKIIDVPIQDDSSWFADGVSYSLNISNGLHFLQVGGTNIPWRFVALPPNQNLLCLIKPAKGTNNYIHPLEITVSTENWTAETLLSFLKTGAMNMAENMFDSSNAAEDLLYHKLFDPAAAAIGGYYLLRVGDLDKLHNWPHNLANWVKWMADGPVIYAWQIIKGSRDSIIKFYDEIKSLLLEATKRGLPIYTEGTRLLYEGLKLLNGSKKGRDKEIREALSCIENYIAAIDWSESTTTFNGKTPGQPIAKAVKGIPKPLDKLAFIFDVPIKELIQMGYIDVGNQFTIKRSDGLSEDLLILKEGKLKAIDGKKFVSPLQATRYFEKPDEFVTIDTKDISSDLDSIISKFRKGKF